uniref:Heat shock protein 70 n=1 Tax=Panagrolaimus davidi TaxID=227884 RepID=A0A914QSI3_9BILA
MILFDLGGGTLDLCIFEVEKKKLKIITNDGNTPLLYRIQEVLKETFSKTKFYASDINKVLLVGGGCRMPMIQQFLRKRFPVAEHSCAENPDEMVAIGAAYYASCLMSDTKGSKGCSVM